MFSVYRTLPGKISNMGIPEIILFFSHICNMQMDRFYCTMDYKVHCVALHFIFMGYFISLSNSLHFVL